jgi:hypothetical protein
MKPSLLCAFCILISITARCGQRPSGARAPEAAEPIAPEEYSVYAAVIKELGAAGLVDHPLINDQTSTFACGTACNGMLVGNCSGMRSENQTPAQALDALSRQLTFLKKETSVDFEAKNQKCASLQKVLPVACQIGA